MNEAGSWQFSPFKWVLFEQERGMNVLIKNFIDKWKTSWALQVFTSLGHKTKHSALKLATVLLNERRAGGKTNCNTQEKKKKLDMVAYRLKPKLRVKLEVKNFASLLFHNVT